MTKLPELTENYVRKLASAQSFSKGQSYYHAGAVENGRCEGNRLYAQVEGSQYQPYRVEIEFDEKGVDTAICTCPYDWGGVCKHIVAVLLEYISSPESFVEQAPLLERLAKHSKEELISIIERMVKRDPELLMIVEQPIASARTRNTAINLDSFRKQLQYGLSHYGAYDDYDYYGGYSSNDNTLYLTINEMINTAKDFGQHSDWKNAVAILGCIVEETVGDDDFELYEDWNLQEDIDRVLSELEKCMQQVKDDDDLRQAILDYWLTAELWDIEQGGIGFAENTVDWFRMYAKAQDIPRLREAVEIAQKKTNNDFEKRGHEFLLTEFDMLDSTDPEETLRRIRENEMFVLLFDKLLEMGRIDDAVIVWKEELAGYEYAQALYKLQNHKQIDLGIRLAEELLQKNYDERIVYWLIDRYKEQGNTEKLIYWQYQQFKQKPGLDNYIALEASAKSSPNWKAMRAEFIEMLEQNKTYDMLIHLYLHEENWDKAWETLPLYENLNLPEWRYGKEPLDFEIAEQSRFANPERSIPIYIKEARYQIGLRQRTYYAEAAEYLTVVRNLYLQYVKDEEAWLELIQGIRQEFKKLPALQDELNQAGLE